MENNKTDYILLGTLIALTGFEFAFRASPFIQFAILICVAIYFFRTGIKFSSVFFLILLPFMLSIATQSLLKPNLYIFVVNTISMIIKLLTCYLILELTKNRLNTTFVGFIYFLALFSLVFYPTQYFPGLQDTIKNGIGSIIKPLGSENTPPGFVSKTLIFFTYHHSYNQEFVEDLRNSGAFWEPGMFAIFLNLALMINIYINKAKLLSHRNIVFIITLITTLSTTGFIVLFLIILSTFILNKKIEHAILYLPIIIGISLIAYTYVWKLEFMSGKVTAQVDNANYNQSSRFGAALFHFEQLKESPLTGVFLLEAQNNKEINFEDRHVTPNGISLIFMVWGIPVALIYFALIYTGLARWLRFNRIDNKLVHFFFFFIVIFSTFSQDITNRHFYYMILFFVACFPRYPIPKPINFKTLELK